MAEVVVLSRNEARNLQMVKELQPNGRWKTKHVPINPTKPAIVKKRQEIRKPEEVEVN